MTSTRYTSRLVAGCLLVSGIAYGQTFTPSLSQIAFSTAGSPPFTRGFTVAVTGGTGRTLTASASTGVGNWLSVTPASTQDPPASVSFTATADPTGLVAGNYTGQIELRMNPASPVTIPVTLTVTASSTQTLVLTPSTLTLSAAAGAAAVSQSVSVAVSQGGVSTAFTAQATSTGNWLAVTPPTGNTPAQLQVTATPGTLTAGSYTGTVTVTPTTGTPATLNVTFNVGQGSGGAITVSSANLSFTVDASTGPSAAQTLTATVASATATTITATPSTTSGGSWLTVTPLTGTAPLSLSVSVNPQGLAAGTYNGAITLNATGGVTGSTPVPVTLTVRGAQSSSIRVDPPAVTFNVPSTGNRTQTQTLNITPVSGSSVQVAASVTGGAWITVNPSSLSAPGTLNISINASGLGDGVYQANIRLAPVGASELTVPVTLNVGGSGSSGGATVFPGALTFVTQSGRPLPGGQLVALEGGPATYTASAATVSGGSWLLVTPDSGSVPGAAVVRLAESVVSSLSAGNYSGTVTITPGGGGLSRSIAVSLTVNANPVLIANPPLLSFSSAIGGASPGPVSFPIESSATTQLPVQLTTTLQSGSGWLIATLSSSTTPSQLSVTVNPGNLATGTYDGNITVSSSQQGVPNVVLPVRLQVRSGSVLSATPGQLTFASSGGSTPSPQTISLSSTGTGAASFTASASGGSWLSVQPGSGGLPGSITVSASPTGLASGDYAGSIAISSTGLANSPLVVPVLFRVTGSTATGITAAPTSLTFTQAAGGAVPPPQTVQLNAASSTSFTATASTPSGGSWLSVTPSSGTTPTSLSVSIASTAPLSAGTYTGSVAVSWSQGNLSIPVTLTVGSASSSPLSATPQTLSFAAAPGGSNPGSQLLQVSASGTSALTFTAAASTQSGGNWLTVTPSSGTTPAQVQVSVSVANLATGTYNGSVALTPQGAQALTIPVTLTIASGSSGGGALPAITSVVHSATQRTGVVAPGLVVFLRGTGLGPASQSLLQLDPQGRVATTLANVRVLFDNLPAPLIAVQQDAISAVVPYAVAGRNSVSLTVENGGRISAATTLNVSDTAPGLFSIAGTGSGQGAILNQDLTINSTNNPAARGSVAVLYVTGDGIVSPGGPDGEVTSGLSRRPIYPLQIRVGGVPVPASNILYHGPAPGIVLGVSQVNFVIPEVAPGAAVPLELTSNGVSSGSAITMAIR